MPRSLLADPCTMLPSIERSARRKNAIDQPSFMQNDFQPSTLT
eukprot:CAMPEP_0201242418 /NCGR_PEP_ID=MMETSP0852-20130820/37878_1 /ASSEMBLY_ACC=CAM_ASM_000632 /TAXON_ID=183588 /ORGANISM="Pseudo-nitzschia fraudulenta, Strain WWA7" /LENGTH=42 /DNA_ID= /DNA_START= /DNA_END= /DNA_ORIENTATION=